MILIQVILIFTSNKDGRISILWNSFVWTKSRKIEYTTLINSTILTANFSEHQLYLCPLWSGLIVKPLPLVFPRNSAGQERCSIDYTIQGYRFSNHDIYHRCLYFIDQENSTQISIGLVSLST